MNLDEILRTDIKSSLTKSGLLLFLAGFMIFMGIITGEIFYKKPISTPGIIISVNLGLPCLRKHLFMSHQPQSSITQ